jgi:hypothetical protein
MCSSVIVIVYAENMGAHRLGVIYPLVHWIKVEVGYCDFAAKYLCGTVVLVAGSAGCGTRQSFRANLAAGNMFSASDLM